MLKRIDLQLGFRTDPAFVSYSFCISSIVIIFSLQLNVSALISVDIFFSSFSNYSVVVYLSNDYIGFSCMSLYDSCYVLSVL